MSNAWIVTVTGRHVDLLDPQPDMFCSEDICHSLSRLCRFNGHTSRFYSVAEHSWFGARELRCLHGEAAGIEFLLHDAHEAYTGDIVRPMKELLGDLGEIQAKIDAAIRVQFGLPATCSAAVHEMDLVMLATEKRDLLPLAIAEWDCLQGVRPLGLRLSAIAPSVVCGMMLEQLRDWCSHSAFREALKVREASEHMALRQEDEQSKELSVVEQAAGELPEDWQIVITVEREAATVALIDPDGDEHQVANGEGVADDVLTAIEMAKTRRRYD